MKQIDPSSRAGMFLAFFVIVVFVLGFGTSSRADTDPKFYTVEASATVQASPAQIRLNWAPDANATGYTVFRKDPAADNWGAGTPLSGSAASFTDGNVSVGTAYEYQISKTTSVGYLGFGYVCAGINVSAVEQRGTVILLVDSLFTVDLANELTRLQFDLVGDGWTVWRHDVSRTDSPQNIKSLIQADYARDPAHVQAVFLFGHIPVPYSGNLNPDGHPDHQGAWPADAYYGDMDGSWTDDSVSNTSAQHQANWNVPGDGKFDQSELPSDIELEVGRVDLSNMTCFSNKTPARYEKDLLRQYLNKDHNFRHGLMAVQRRGLVCDNFGEKSGEAFAASGWRNFSAFFGADNVTAVQGWNYFSTLASESYLWSYGCGGGSYYTCDGIGSSDDFANTDVKTVFTMLLGSYFGDWDNESNFLRAPLGSTSSTLAVAWAGRPHWFFHHMGLGQTIGYSTRLSQNNRNGGLYSAQNYDTHDVHVALMGDPTLRMHPVIPPSSLSGTVLPSAVTLSWTASSDTALQGYHIYRAGSPNGPFTRISGNAPLAQTTFADSVANGSTYTYMVRAVKLETSGSGTYFNPSQGVFFGPDSSTSWGGGDSSSIPVVPAAPTGLQAAVTSSSAVTLSWNDVANNESGYRLERKTGANGAYNPIANLGAGATRYTDINLGAGTLYSYRVAAYNSVGNSAYSNEASAATPSVPSVPAEALFLGVDATTAGDWDVVYGAEGYTLAGAGGSMPGYAVLTTAGRSDWTWAWPTSDGRGLMELSTGQRIAASWYSTTSFTVDLDLRDVQTHQVSLYCVDWDTAARRQTVDVLDASTGEILNSQSIAAFNGGVYLRWNLAGHVVIRFTRNGGFNATLSGIFFDGAGPISSPAAAPTIIPSGGSFAAPTQVTLSSTTPGATIRYTVDGTDPTSASTLYQGALTVGVSELLKAKTFVNGLVESSTATAAFTLNGISSGQARVLFVRSDGATQGNWKGVYGAEGYEIIGDATALPGYVEVAPVAANRFIWADSTTDARALQKANGTDRLAASWFDSAGFSVDVNFVDDRTHRLAVYCLDWDYIGRVQTVEILDAATGALLTSQSVSGFSGGRYLVWDIQGHVQLRFTKQTGNNAVLMGLFFSPAAIQLGTPGSGALAVSPSTPLADGQFRFRVSGQVGQRFAIQASTDLVSWKTIQEVTLAGPTLDLADPGAVSGDMHFYRALPTTGTNP